MWYTVLRFICSFYGKCLLWVFSGFLLACSQATRLICSNNTLRLKYPLNFDVPFVISVWKITMATHEGRHIIIWTVLFRRQSSNERCCIHRHEQFIDSHVIILLKNVDLRFYCKNAQTKYHPTPTFFAHLNAYRGVSRLVYSLKCYPQSPMASNTIAMCSDSIYLCLRLSYVSKV